MRKKKRKVIRKPFVGPPPEVMDIKTLAHYLGLGRSKIYNLIRQKKIPASRIGRQYRFSRSIIDQWLTERLITRTEETQIPLFKGPAREDDRRPTTVEEACIPGMDYVC